MARIERQIASAGPSIHPLDGRHSGRTEGCHSIYLVAYANMTSIRRATYPNFRESPNLFQYPLALSVSKGGYKTTANPPFHTPLHNLSHTGTSSL